MEKRSAQGLKSYISRAEYKLGGGLPRQNTIPAELADWLFQQVMGGVVCYYPLRGTPAVYSPFFSLLSSHACLLLHHVST